MLDTSNPHVTDTLEARDDVLDFVAIGIGPFNLSLACLSEPLEDVQGVFLERKAAFDWHPGMLLEDASMQTPFMADMVSLADPTSHFSFLNYLKLHDKLYNFYIREDFFLLRREYNQYCQWAARELSSLRFDHDVQDIQHVGDIYIVRGTRPSTGEAFAYRARKLVLGTGTQPYLPKAADAVRDVVPVAGSRVCHNAHYLARKEELTSQPAITIIGSGQSAAEIYLDLLREIDQHSYQLNWITRSPRFFPLEYGKLTLEMTSPDYIDYFHALPREQRNTLLATQKGLYKGINLELIDEIYDTLYAKQLQGVVPTTLMTNTELTSLNKQETNGDFTLGLYQREQQQAWRHGTSAVVLATGYHYVAPPFLRSIESRIRRDEEGRYAVGRFYAVDTQSTADADGNEGDQSPFAGEIFVQNAELHTHSLAAPDLGMACYRNSCILRAITGREVYTIERRIAFQSFGTPGSEKGCGNGFTPLPAAHLPYGETDIHAGTSSTGLSSAGTASTDSSSIDTVSDTQADTTHTAAPQHRETTA